MHAVNPAIDIKPFASSPADSEARLFTTLTKIYNEPAKARTDKPDDKDACDPKLPATLVKATNAVITAPKPITVLTSLAGSMSILAIDLNTLSITLSDSDIASMPKPNCAAEAPTAVANAPIPIIVPNTTTNA